VNIKFYNFGPYDLLFVIVCHIY